MVSGGSIGSCLPLDTHSGLHIRGCFIICSFQPPTAEHELAEPAEDLGNSFRLGTLESVKDISGRGLNARSNGCQAH